jgi:hypothetical protein
MTSTTANKAQHLEELKERLERKRVRLARGEYKEKCLLAARGYLEVKATNKELFLDLVNEAERNGQKVCTSVCFHSHVSVLLGKSVITRTT